MNLVQILALVVVAGICGSIAQALTGFSRGGCLVSVAVGFVGALLGQWISNAVGVAPILPIEIGGKDFPIVWSVIGGVLFSIAIAYATKNKEKLKR